MDKLKKTTNGGWYMTPETIAANYDAERAELQKVIGELYTEAGVHVDIAYRVVIHDKTRNIDVEVAFFHKYVDAEHYICELARSGALKFEKIVLMKE